MSMAMPVSATFTTRTLPVVIQGGMGVAVSSWPLARAVSRTGQLGVVSGTALDVVLARRLQDGDQDGDIRRALEHFPVAEVAERVLTRYFRAQGRPAGRPYIPVPRLRLRARVADQELSVVANFVEVWLAKDGHDGLVGINFLEKVQMATPAAAYGAMLAGVDYVLMGAGIPTEIPQLLDRLARHEVGRLNVDVAHERTACTGTSRMPASVRANSSAARPVGRAETPTAIARFSSSRHSCLGPTMTTGQ